MIHPQESIPCFGYFAAVEIAIGKNQLACAYFFKKDAVLIGGRINALDIQIFGLRSRVVEPHSLEGANLRNKFQKRCKGAGSETRLGICFASHSLIVGTR